MRTRPLLAALGALAVLASTAPLAAAAGPAAGLPAAPAAGPAVGLAAGLAPAATATRAAAAAEPAVWLCRPGLADDPCEAPQDTTVVAPDGTERVVTPPRPPQDRRPVDCFFVYPTVSNDVTPSSDRSVDPELRDIATFQASRFGQHCRIFAPVYRQRTLLALATADRVPVSTYDADAVTRTAYEDVRDAWREYLRKDNRGRGVVLVGHSQGTRMLRALLRRDVETDPRARRLLVGAVLLGGNVLVPKGRTVGGDFARTPLCTRRAQAGCVVAYSTYQQDPPADARFGRAPAERDRVFGFPGGPGVEVACTDPAVLLGRRAPVGVTVPTKPFTPGLILAGIIATNSGTPPVAATSWVTPADRYAGTCRRSGDTHVYRYDAVGDSRELRDYPDDTWGTHLVDVNLGLERLVDVVGQQVRTWQRTR